VAEQLDASTCSDDERTRRGGDVHRQAHRGDRAGIRATLSSLLGDATDEGLIDRNPAALARIRKGKKRASDTRPPLKAWGPEEVATFLDRAAADEHPLWPLFHLAAYLGLRRGELCGLRWSSVDLDNAILYVERTRTSAGYRIIEDDPKSAASKAPVALDSPTIAVLRGLRKTQATARLSLGEAWAGGDYVFVRPDGQPWHPDAVSKGFGLLVSKYGLPRLSLHGLRHTSASVQIAAGVPIEIVSKRLRHADVKLTSAVYSHLVGTVGKDAAEATAALISQYRKTV
jgi:integrase